MPTKKPHPAEEKLHNLKLKEMRYHHFIYNLYRKLFVAQKELEWCRSYLYNHLTEEDGVSDNKLGRVDEWFKKHWEDYALELSEGRRNTRMVKRAKEEVPKHELREIAKQSLKEKSEYDMILPDVDETLAEIDKRVEERK